MKIALVQSPLVWGKLQENLQNFDKKMAKSEDCDVILLPEMFTSGCMMIKKSVIIPVPWAYFRNRVFHAYYNKSLLFV